MWFCWADHCHIRMFSALWNCALKNLQNICLHKNFLDAAKLHHFFQSENNHLCLTENKTCCCLLLSIQSHFAIYQHWLRWNPKQRVAYLLTARTHWHWTRRSLSTREHPAEGNAWETKGHLCENNKQDLHHSQICDAQQASGGLIPFFTSRFFVRELVPWQHVQPMGELLMTVVDYTSVDGDRARDVNRCHLKWGVKTETIMKEAFIKKQNKRQILWFG